MAAKPAPTISEAIGAAVRRYRDQHGISQDQLAAELRISGLDWTSSVVAALETGRREVQIGEAILLAHALSLPLVVLLAADRVQLLPGLVTVSGEDLIRALAGHRLEREALHWTPGSQPVTPAVRRGALKAILAMPPELVASEVEKGNYESRFPEMYGDAVVGLAKSLHVLPIQVAAAARLLWGHDVVEERERRVSGRAGEGASARSRQALRGWATREIKKDIEALLSDLKGQRRS